MGGVILSINAGSSSLKVAVFDESNIDAPTTSASIEGIGTDASCFIPNGEYGSNETRAVPIPTIDAAIQLVSQWLSELNISPNAIGHRVVHGGERFSNAALLDDDVVTYLATLTPLAPNHMPGTLAAITAFRSAYPDTPQVACFDTAFFAQVPTIAKTLPIPKELGLKRYGFHGLSYASLLKSFAEHEGETAAHGRVIMAHLGSGASVCAVKNGQPIDMTMGFTPISGIMMSTRTGDLEPGVLTYLQQEKDYDTTALTELVSKQSGLLGVSGLSADMHTLLQAQAENPDAALAIELFCYKLTKQIGAFAAALGGVDSVIFSGGIGERSAEIRARICQTLSFLGIIVDEQRNNANERLISADTSGVGVHIIPAKEDASIVRQTAAVLQERASA